MAHAHAHGDNEGEGNFFLDQLFTILSCGALGIVALLMYRSGMLSRILVPFFWLPVAVGGGAVLLLVVIRGIALWQLAGKAKAAAEAEECGVNHGAGEDCGVEHSHAQEDDHGHNHGWAPWRYMVLAVPVFLYFLDLPRSGYSENRIDREVRSGSLQKNPQRQALAALAGGPVFSPAYRKPNPSIKELRFKELAEVTAVPSRHEAFEGDIGIIRGQFWPMKEPGEFTLFRMNMTCCAADTVMLQVRIVAPPDAVAGIKRGQWVRVTGLISFEQIGGRQNTWVPVITLSSEADVERNVEATTDYEGF